jgi:multidrug resistance protein MdtO
MAVASDRSLGSCRDSSSCGWSSLAREPISDDLQTAIECSYSLREIINAQFEEVRSLADSVLFEFGTIRQKDLVLRTFARRRQPELRIFCVTQIASA